MSQRVVPGFLVALSLCLGCRTTAPKNEPEGSAPHVGPSASPSPQAALEALDQRRPVPLLPMMAQHQKENMRQHLEAVEAVVTAAAVGDFAQVAVAAKRMGYSDAMGRMCQHMGAGAPGFTEQALSFHHTADEIAEAATKQDQAAVLAALSETLRACTSCHQTYKQQLVASLPP
jgi:hypothetical protein